MSVKFCAVIPVVTGDQYVIAVKMNQSMGAAVFFAPRRLRRSVLCATPLTRPAAGRLQIDYQVFVLQHQQALPECRLPALRQAMPRRVICSQFRRVIGEWVGLPQLGRIDLQSEINKLVLRHRASRKTTTQPSPTFGPHDDPASDSPLRL